MRTRYHQTVIDCHSKRTHADLAPLENHHANRAKGIVVRLNQRQNLRLLLIKDEPYQRTLFADDLQDAVPDHIKRTLTVMTQQLDPGALAHVFWLLTRIATHPRHPFC